MGKLYYDMADWQTSIAYYRQALPLLQAAGDARREAAVTYSLGVASFLTNPDAATEYCWQSLALRRKVGDRPGEAQTLAELGGMYNALGKLPEAVRSADEALAIQRSLGDRQGQGRTLRTLGLAHAKLGHADQARTALDEAVTIARTVQDRRNEGLNLNALGWSQSLAGKPDLARESFDAARKIAEQIGDRDTLANSLKGMARAERDLGNLADARRDAEAALQLVEKVRSNAGGEEARASYLSSPWRATNSTSTSSCFSTSRLRPWKPASARVPAACWRCSPNRAPTFVKASIRNSSPANTRSPTC
jgi:tetratricopeptide (TPR) repeat protein